MSIQTICGDISLRLRDKLHSLSPLRGALMCSLDATEERKMQTLAGISINDKIFVPLFKEQATVVGFRYYTSRNNGRTSMVADYITDSGKASFDGLERVREWLVK
jgi:hypothetical protein